MPGQAEVPVCVFCRRQPVADPWRPFCSERCKLQDLARWADGTYRAAGDAIDRGERSEVSDRKDPE